LVLEHLPFSSVASVDKSVCSIVVYRGPRLGKREATRGVLAGRAAGVLVETAAIVGSPCAEEPLEYREHCPETAESQFQSGVTLFKKKMTDAETHPISLPKFGAEASQGAVVCRRKVCQVFGTWWTTATHEILFMEVSVRETQLRTTKRLDNLASPAVSVFFG
jgi:hypothetical protein